MRKMTLKNKIRYKLWKHMKKKLNKKIEKVFSTATYFDKLRYKIFKYLSKKLSKKNLIPDVSADLRQFKEYISGAKYYLPMSAKQGDLLGQQIKDLKRESEQFKANYLGSKFMQFDSGGQNCLSKLVYKYKLFNIPILTIKKKNKKTRYLLFSFIPILTLKEKKNQLVYRWFGLIKIVLTKK